MALQRGELVAEGGQADDPPTLAEVLPDGHLELVTGPLGAQRGARREPATRPHQRLPDGRPSLLALPPLEQQHLGGAAGLLAEVQPGGQDTGGVDHQQVAGFEQVGQVGHGPGVLRGQ